MASEATTLPADAGTEATRQVAPKEATVMSRRRFQSGSLFKRGRRHKVWVGRWWEDTLKPDGTIGRIRRAEVLGSVTEIPTRRQAQVLLEQRLRAINQGTFRPQSQITFNEFALEQFEPVVLPTLKFSTSRNYRHLTRRHLLPPFGEMKLSEVDRVRVQQFVTEKIVGQGFSWKTGQHLRNLLSKIFGTAAEWGYLNSNPVRGVRLPPREPRRERHFLTRGQVGRLLQVLTEPVRTLVLTAVLTGASIGELLALRWCRVDLDRCLIRIRESVYEGHFSTPKTRNRVRDIPIGPVLQQALRRHIGSVGIPAPEALVFPSRNGTPFRPGNLLRRYLRPACKLAGLPPVGWHAFRHTHATLLGDSGGSLKIAQAQLGHSSSAITAEVYTHVVPETQRAAVEKLEQAILGSQLDSNGPKFTTASEGGSSVIQ